MNKHFRDVQVRNFSLGEIDYYVIWVPELNRFVRRFLDTMDEAIEVRR